MTAEQKNLRFYQRFIKRLKTEGQLLLSYKPGERFHSYYKLRRQKNPIKSVLTIIFGGICLILALIFAVLPGPAIIFWILGFALVSSQLLSAARLLDRGELFCRKMLEKKEREEFFRFLFSGVIVVLVDLSIYYVSLNHFPFGTAKAISFISGSCVAYILNKYWTFKKNVHSYPEVLRFFVANSLGLGLNITINHIALYFFPMWVLVAWVAATTVTAIFSFIVFKFWVFKVKH